MVRPEERLRIGECLDIGGIVAQVIDIEYATLPGILEHILRKSLLEETETEEPVQEEVRNLLDTVADYRLAVTKIRGMVKDRQFHHGITEFSIARSRTPVVKIEPAELLRFLNITSQFEAEFARLLTEPQIDFKLLLDRLGINLITGMKGSGKSYSAKKILLRLIENGKVTVVFDLNGEYLNLWKGETGRPGSYATLIKVLDPRATRATANEIPFKIPLEEIDYDEFADFTNIDRASQMYNELIVFWSSQRGPFDFNDLEQFASELENEFVRKGLEGKIRAAKAMNLFGPSDIARLINDFQESGGAIILNLTNITKKEREVLVRFVLRRLATLGQKGGIMPISVFAEEAQLYVTSDMVHDLLTRMRHYGIFPTFITNDPRSLPSEVFSLCDNLIAFRFHNPDDLNQIAKAKMVDVETLGLLRQIQDWQCIVVGDVTRNFPLLMEVNSESGVMMGGETKRLFS